MMKSTTILRAVLAIATSLASACGSGGGRGTGGEGEACNEDGTCETGLECVGGICAVIDTPCATDDDCDDHSLCTADSCDEEAGVCEHEGIDEDGDGFAAAVVGTDSCGGRDCDDGDPAINPGAEAGCEPGVDADCNGVSDLDEDSDGVIREACGGPDCDDWDNTVPDPFGIYCVEADRDCNGLPDEDNDGDGHLRDECDGGDDCDDEDDEINPDGVEACDTIDSDCDGDLTDAEGADVDGDGYVGEACGGDDCDDGDAAINPGAVEECDGIDGDCDGSLADAPGADDDADGYLDATCGGGDCDDGDEAIHPGGAEACDEVDSDCDGDLADAPGADMDYDGYTSIGCGGTDCNDYDPSAFPGAEEWCDTVDQNCDGSLLDAPDADDDMDGYMDVSCGGDDCEDWEAGVHPGAVEICDSLDQNCAFTNLDAPGADDDMDYYLDSACGGDDCNDADGSINPGAWEVCDTVDSDCDGDLADSTGADGDGDGYVNPACGGDDCDDADRLVSPFAPEICDSTDNDCDGAAAEPGSVLWWEPFSGGYVGMTPDVEWTGSEYGVAWVDIRHGLRDLYFARIAADGTAIGSGVRATPGGARANMPQLSWTGTGYGLTWWDTRLGAGEIYLQRLGTDGTPTGGEVRLTIDLNASQYPAIAWTGSEWGIAWLDTYTGPGKGLYFMRVGADGAKIGSSSLVMSRASTSTFVPSIAWTGSSFGVAATDGVDEAVFALLPPDGSASAEAVMDSSGLTVPVQRPGLSWTGNAFGMAWLVKGASTTGVKVGMVSGSGVPAGAPATTAMRPNPYYLGVIEAWTGAGLHVYWLAGPAGTGSGDRLWMGRFSDAGAAIGSEASIFGSSGQICNEQHPLAIAWDGNASGIAMVASRFSGSWVPVLLRVGDCP